eukprot:TRINITY_DN16160_c0_g1_i1.p1 TRINITY_DN16160_c0_g1~~TRINITY_DN16160_c0_g1_i1.p1  ORF type:complete len:230 (+),score=62.74 TRINITY_DN16160_c0_g1_i1:95-784(+)
MEHPAARECNLVHNPLHQDQLEILAMLPSAVYALNVVLDEARSVCHVAYGEILASHAQAVEHVRPFAQVGLGRKFHTVVSSAAGYPLDQTYYQTIKAMTTLLDIVHPGGDIIVASEISEGLGSEEFRDAQARLVELGPEKFLATLLCKDHADIDEWQTEMLLRALRIGNVYLYSPMMAGRAEDAAVSGVTLVPDLEQAIRESVARSGDSHIAVIPEGPYVIPKCSSSIE